MMALPDRGWASYEDALRRVGERRFNGADKQLVRILSDLKLVADSPVRLTESGERYFQARFITHDHDGAEAVLHAAVLAYPPAAAISQLLAGVGGADRTRAETILRSRGFDVGLSQRSLSSLLMLMHHAGVISYDSRDSSIRVLDSAALQADVPPSIFVSPRTPFGNKIWLRRVLEECEGYIHWLDKHFMPVAFEALWEAVDGSRITEVQILSLRLTDHEGKRTMRQYRDLVAEVKHRGITLEWRVIDSGLIKDTHDRWIISNKRARNVPNVGAIYSGQHSEMNVSDQATELNALFVRYWAQAAPIDNTRRPANSSQ